MTDTPELKEETPKLITREEYIADIKTRWKLFVTEVKAFTEDVKKLAKKVTAELKILNFMNSKTVDLKGNFKTEFEDGKKQKIPLEIARKLSTKYNMLKKPIEKEIFQKRIAKSYRDLLKVAKEK